MSAFQLGWKNLEGLRKMLYSGFEKLDAFDCFYSSSPTNAFECLQPPLQTQVFKRDKSTLLTRFSEHYRPALPNNALECFRTKGNIGAIFIENETKNDYTRQHQYIKKHQTIVKLQYLEKLYNTVKMLNWRLKRNVHIPVVRVFILLILCIMLFVDCNYRIDSFPVMRIEVDKRNSHVQIPVKYVPAKKSTVSIDCIEVYRNHSPPAQLSKISLTCAIIPLAASRVSLRRTTMSLIKWQSSMDVIPEIDDLRNFLYTRRFDPQPRIVEEKFSPSTSKTWSNNCNQKCVIARCSMDKSFPVSRLSRRNTRVEKTWMRATFLVSSSAADNCNLDDLKIYGREKRQKVQKFIENRISTCVSSLIALPRETKLLIWLELLSMTKSLRRLQPSSDSSMMSRTASFSAVSIFTRKELCMFCEGVVCRLIEKQPKSVSATPASDITNCSSIEGSFMNKEVAQEQHNNIGENDKQTLDNDFYNNITIETVDDMECIFDILNYLGILMFLEMLLELLQFRRDDTKKEKSMLKLRRKVGYLQGISVLQFDDGG